MTRSSSPDRGQEWFDIDDVHHAREVVGEHVVMRRALLIGSVGGGSSSTASARFDGSGVFFILAPSPVCGLAQRTIT
jgi:hypothetical protein